MEASGVPSYPLFGAVASAYLCTRCYLKTLKCFKTFLRTGQTEQLNPEEQNLGALSSFFPWVMALVRAVEAKLREEEMR